LNPTATLLACLPIALCAALPAHATGARVEVHGQALHRLTPAQASELQGHYALADGRTLVVTRQGARVMAELDGHAAAPLQALSATRLLSADGRLALDFEAAANGNVSAVRLTQRSAAR
jgi:hypothetical protein